MHTQKNKICPDCGKKIWSGSIHCSSCARKGKRNYFFGKHYSRLGKNSSAWKGDKAGYKAIHIWVNSHKGTPQICENCNATNKEARIEWANKDHRYRRNLDDYFALCCKCHQKYDREKGFLTYIPKQDSVSGKFVSL